jgi:molecular chaperone DnaK (HSP70)
MEEDITREEEKLDPTAKGKKMEKAEGDAPVSEETEIQEGAIEEEIDEETLSLEGRPEDEQQKALQKSIGLGLPSDRYRVVLPKGSFPPLTARQQFIARLRDRDRVSFRVFQGDEELASQNEFLAEIGMVGVALNNEDKAFLEIDLHYNIDKILTVRLLDKFGEKEALVVLDMARRPKMSIHQDKVAELMEKLDSIGHRIEEIGERLNASGTVTSEQDSG